MSAQHETHSIDRLYLELSQFTKAKTAREISLEAALKAAIEGLKGASAAMADLKGDAWQEWRNVIHDSVIEANRALQRKN